MKKFAIIGFDEKTSIHVFIEKIKKLSEKLNFKCDYFIYSKKDFNLYDKLYDNQIINCYDAAISIGGDGTFLYTSRIFAGTDIPVFGVNLSNLGFNTRIEIDEIEQYILNFLENRLECEYRDILEVSIGNSNETYCVINDGVISHTGISRMIRLKVSLNDEPVYNFNGDGIIISTSIGSTAYNLSAGGPILHPSVKAIAMSPICAHTLAIRPYIIPINEIITIEVLQSSAQPQITLDGQKTIILTPGEKIFFKNSHKKIKIIKTVKSFSEILKDKLGWNI